MHISCNILQRVEIITTLIRHAFHVMILFILYLPQHYIIYFDILRGGTVQDYRVSCYDSLIVKETLPGIINRVIFEISCFLKGQNIRKNSLTIQVCWFYMLIQTVTINSNCYVPKCQNKDFINSRFCSESTKISKNIRLPVRKCQEIIYVNITKIEILGTARGGLLKMLV